MAQPAGRYKSTLTVSSTHWALVLANLAAYYDNDSIILFITSHADVNGDLVIVVHVLGFSTNSAATASYDDISTNGIHWTDSAFGDVITSVSVPALSCSNGYSTDSSGNCADTDGLHAHVYQLQL
jgi:hypothetical protein